jgi:hypothetical protein
MLSINCDICQSKLDEPGALVFSPPITETWLVEKYHVCARCWPKLAALVKVARSESDFKHTT